MASGSHTYSGIWALLPKAPSISRNGMALTGQPPASITAAAEPACSNCLNNSAYSTVPNACQVR
jgi:hypothetical protein